MEAFLRDLLGPLTNAILASALALVVMTRRSIRKAHIVALVLVTVVTSIALFSLLLWGFTWHDGTQSVALFQVVLKLMAGVIVGCGSAAGFYFVLRSVGLASPPDSGSSE
jgi:drug/metabolite transporter (DMT)-like permease